MRETFRQMSSSVWLNHLSHIIPSSFMNHSIAGVFTWLLLAIACLQIGCGPAGPPMHQVTGTVTLDGKPMATGVIYFKDASKGEINSIEIIDGGYTGNVQEGKRWVEISLLETKIIDRDGMESPISTNLVDPKFHRNSTLTVTVTPAGPNEFDFQVTSAK